MKYNKKPITFEQQADIIIARGIICERKELIDILRHINYYRITAYLYPFRMADSEDFIEGVSIDRVMNLYAFDEILRLLVLEGLELIEVSIFRTQIVELLTTELGPFCYLDRRIYTRGAKADEFHKDINKKSQALFRGMDSDIRRFKDKYEDSDQVPFWIIVEKFQFGTMTHFYKNLDDKYRRVISKRLGVPPVVLESWLHLLNKTRNYCAHHARLWNRKFTNRPRFPYEHINDTLIDVKDQAKKYNHTSIFTVLSIMIFLNIYIDKSGRWKNKLLAHLNTYPETSMRNMGFPKEWASYQVWR